MAQKSSSQLHEGHRARMRERLERAGAEGFADHELLEMLLYYVQPRRDTNEMAHQLIEECGSLSAVLEAPPERLCRVPFVKENTSVYLRLLGELSKRYARSKFTLQNEPLKTVYDSNEKLASVIYPRFIGQTTERMLVLLFDGGMHMVDCFTAAEGSINAVALTVRSVAERAFTRGACSVILAHNHPGGVATPSPEDLKLTQSMITALDLLGIPLVEHFVFTERSYFPIIANCFDAATDVSEHQQAAQFRRMLKRKNTL